jgi:hypothetical protein
MPTHLFNAFFNSQEGTELGGPVTVEMGEYLFVNKNSADDIYFNLIPFRTHILMPLVHRLMSLMRLIS